MSKSGDFNGGKEHLVFANGTISDRVRIFSTCGRSAQLLLLENGCWTRLNKWTEYAITSKDTPLIKEILNTLWTMPTSWSQLDANRRDLPITLQKLLKRLAFGSKEFGDESEALKLFIAELFVRWLRIKKDKVEETDNERIQIEGGGETGGVIALVKNKPGYGFLAQNGNVTLIQLKPYQTQLFLDKANISSSSCPEDTAVTVSKNNQEKKNDSNDEKMAPELPHPSSSPSCSEEMNSSSCSSIIDVDEENVNMEQTTHAPPITSTPNKRSVTPAQMFEMHNTSLEEIENDIQNQSAQLWKELDKAEKVQKRESSEMDCLTAPPKKSRLYNIYSDDEYDDDIEPRLVIDEGQETGSNDVVEMDEPVEASRHETVQSLSKKVPILPNGVPWKLFKIKFPPGTTFPVVNSDEERVQKIRERMAIKANFEPGSCPPDYPVGCDEEDLIEDDESEDDHNNTTLVLISTKDVVDGENSGVLDTVVTDYVAEQWPCECGEV